MPPDATFSPGESAQSILSSATLGPQNAANPRVDDKGNSVPNLVRELFIRAREVRRPMLQQWKLNYRSLNNRAYRPGMSPWDEEPAVNQIWPVIASLTSWMTDQRPTFRVTPTAEAFSEYWDFYEALSRDLNTVLTALFMNYRLDSEVSKCLWDVHTYGIGYLKTQWEPWLADGLGDMCFRRVDPYTIYVDPYASNDSNMTYIIEAKTMTVDDADRAWPGAKALLGYASYVEEADMQPTKTEELTQNYRPRISLGPITGAGIPTNSAGNNAPYGTSRDKFRESPIITVLECYIRGYNTEKADTEGVTKVHDDWRCVVVSGNTVLVNKKCSEIYPFNTHPYDRLVLDDSGEWYGPCIVEMLTPLQRQINWLLGAISRNIYLMGNPVLLEDPRSATMNQRFTNRPGQRLKGSDGVRWMDPPQIQSTWCMDLIQFLKGEIESISGLSAMVRGFAPGGRNAQGVLDSIQDAAFVRVRASLRELERCLRGVGMKMAAGVAEFYTEPRLMSIIGPDGRTMSLALEARHFYARDDEDYGKILPLRFTVNCDAGSSLPTSKQARSAEAKHLFDIGAIDILELLRAIEWPNYAEVAQRVMEQQMLAAQQEAAPAPAA